MSCVPQNSCTPQSSFFVSGRWGIVGISMQMLCVVFTWKKKPINLIFSLVLVRRGSSSRALGQFTKNHDPHKALSMARLVLG